MTLKLTIQEAEGRHPDMKRGQVWEGVDAKYDFVCAICKETYWQQYHMHNSGHRHRKCIQPWSRGPNRFEHRQDGTTALFLERRDGTQLECLVWTRDYELVCSHRWYADWNATVHTFYARTNGADKNRRGLRMHSLLVPNCENVDHQNHNGLDNRIYDETTNTGNIRPATTSENMRNTRKQRACASQFKGVTRHRKKWAAAIRVNQKTLHLGSFDTELEASFAYQEAAQQYYGDFACFGTRDNSVTRVQRIATETIGQDIQSLAARIAKHEAPVQVKVDPDAARLQLVKLSLEKILNATEETK